ncbi:Chaperone protein dnaJ 49 [Cinnamomum micranthum f. kanehirae]|uniref:Chaperone protein dnaJ 49 n=1 Tax=Cinnamomum micranthum f. kanehirae TaxID=337451 RepID=A0A3S3P506_9MAGN|nr:Chaperone protein dnaJ 49 [Cinnamomum micranthum f. kanehirae]
MDGNKDEALKCLKIGKQALETGDRTRALKFLSKAGRLDPTLPIEDLISNANEQSSPDSPPPPSDPARDESPVSNKAPGATSARVRVSANGPPSPSSCSSSNSYTEEQISTVRQIKKQKDYYAILGLEKGSSVDEVRKAYRKLSLKVHPDKNKAPGAEEAFKAVSKAFQCLSDDESRKRYDLVGSEEELVQQNRSYRTAQQGFNGFYEAEFDPDEIFRNFFFGNSGMAPTAASFQGFRFGNGHAHASGNAHGSGNANIRVLIQLLPLFLFLLLNFIPSSEPIYSLSRQNPYRHQFVTERGVHFYVKTSKFEEEYPIDSNERIVLERQVEREYIGLLSQHCRVEMQRRQWGLAQQTPYCDRLRQQQRRWEQYYLDNKEPIGGGES